MAVFVFSVCGANAAQHQDRSTPRLSVPAVVAPLGALAKPAAAERIVVAQRRRGVRRGAPRRVYRGGGRRYYRGGRRGGGVAAGVAAGIIGLGVAAAIANSGRASATGYYDGGYYYEGAYVGRGEYCSRLRWRCREGDDWGCRTYRRDC
jgi:hypothetical protein